MTEATAVLNLWQGSGATVSVTDTVEDVRAAIASNSLHLLVAEHNGQMIGTLIAGFDGWRGNMYRLVVHPDYRRRGIATALVAEAEARFRQQGVRRITILVEKDHGDAMSFWQSVSYTCDERIRRFFHNL